MSQAAEFKYFCGNCQISGIKFHTIRFLAELIASNQVHSLFRLSVCVCVFVCAVLNVHERSILQTANFALTKGCSRKKSVPPGWMASRFVSG